MVLIREKVSTSEIVYLFKGRSKGRSKGGSKGRSESRSKDGSKSKSRAKRYVPVVWQLGHYCFSKQARML